MLITRLLHEQYTEVHGLSSFIVLLGSRSVCYRVVLLLLVKQFYAVLFAIMSDVFNNSVVSYTPNIPR